MPGIALLTAVWAIFGFFTVYFGALLLERAWWAWTARKPRRKKK